MRGEMRGGEGRGGGAQRKQDKRGGEERRGGERRGEDAKERRREEKTSCACEDISSAYQTTQRHQVVMMKHFLLTSCRASKASFHSRSAIDTAASTLAYKHFTKLVADWRGFASSSCSVSRFSCICHVLTAKVPTRVRGGLGGLQRDRSLKAGGGGMKACARGGGARESMEMISRAAEEKGRRADGHKAD
eukprot:764505-Hanusia_phi.AAC.1